MCSEGFEVNKFPISVLLETLEASSRIQNLVKTILVM